MKPKFGFNLEMSNREIQLGEFCDLFQANPRPVRYILERGFVPNGVEVSPSTGKHRQFGPGESFWLAMVYQLKESGIKVPQAAQIADYAMDSIRTITRNLNWDWQFRPESGCFDTDQRYVLEVGDSDYVRVATTANPSHDGMYEFDWHRVKRIGKPIRDVHPFVIVQVDMGRIAKALAAIDWT